MSIKQDMLDNMENALAAISIAGGYNTDIKLVRQYPLPDDGPNQPWIAIIEDSERIVCEDDINIRFELRISLILYYDTKNSIREHVTKLADDVKSAIYAPMNLGSYCLKCWIDEQQSLAVTDTERQGKIHLVVMIIYYAPKAGF